MYYYLSFYNCPAIAEDQRYDTPAANAKIEYIAKTLVTSGVEHLQIISLAGSKKLCHGKTVNIDDKIDLRVFPTLGSDNKLRRGISFLYMQFLLFFFLISSVKKNDTVIVYHSLFYMFVVSLAKRIRGFRLVQEVEEIYSDVTGNISAKKKEMRFFQCADAYVFPTKMLNDLINTDSKSFVIVHGTYRVEQDRGQRFEDNRIHVIYAGTLDPRKGGALAAVSAGAFLNEEYHIHILGFGNDSEKKQLIKTIQDVSQTTSCKITFDGLKSGEDYIKFIQKCQIGLSTQNPDAAFNDTSFPSKILSYLSNGLRVVSICIPAVETSAVGDILYYYEIQTPEKVAEAIRNVSFEDEYDSRSVINSLRNGFASEIKNILLD